MGLQMAKEEGTELAPNDSTFRKFFSVVLMCFFAAPIIGNLIAFVQLVLVFADLAAASTAAPEELAREVSLGMLVCFYGWLFLRAGSI